MLSDETNAWIDQVMPDLGGIRNVRIYVCSRLPFAWLPGFGRRFDGLTLWRSVYIHERAGAPGEKNDCWMELLFHELVHVEQFRRAPLAFPFWYLWKLARMGYCAHPAEIEACERGAKLMQKWKPDA
ncbi:MAG TPA: hypothetical protein VEJ63_14735 [Planctomycetota bacterium]|nr:hypothetical protein [Planctomycetota bacterium]